MASLYGTEYENMLQHEEMMKQRIMQEQEYYWRGMNMPPMPPSEVLSVSKPELNKKLLLCK
jgi:hypothetical protein